ncbi:MAG: nitrous oxide reductase family maturation protein NosD [Candidatus Bathyarchaeia archaeon]
MIRKKLLVAAFAFLLLFPVGLSFSQLKVAEANFLYPPLQQICLTANGTITPSTAPIRCDGDVYFFTGNITDFVIEVERDNIVIDGAGYTMLKTMPALGRQDAVALKARINVTLKNLYVTGFGYGVFLSNSRNCAVCDSVFVSNQYGVALADAATGNLISGNRFTSRGGIFIQNSVNNVLRSNSMLGAGPNLWVDCENATNLPLKSFINDIDASNTINGKSIYYWVNQHNKTVPLNAGYVALINCSGITARHLNLSDNGQGIVLISTTNSTVTQTNITNNDKGVALFNSQNNTITSNNIANNTYGILTYSQSNVFRSNCLVNNTYDVNFEDRFVDEFDYSNIVDGSPICYWIWQNNKTVPPNVGYVVLLSCSNITVQNLNITNRRQAMLLVGVTNSTITRNIITNNQAGIVMRGSSGNLLSGNLVANNSDGFYMEASGFNEVSTNRMSFNENFGIHLDDCDNNAFTRNYITHSKKGFTINRGGNNTLLENSILYSSEKGLHVGESVNNLITRNNIAWSKSWALTITGSVGNNLIHHNDFVNNVGGYPYQTYPANASFNLWDDGKEGNFWSDYSAKHPTANEVPELGVYDSAVVMNDNNVDHHPLSKPVNLKYTLTIMQPANTTYPVSSVPLAFFATADVPWLGYSLDGNANVTANGKANLDTLAAGVHSVTAYAGNSEGGVCSSETVYFEVVNASVAEVDVQLVQPTASLTQSPQPTPTPTLSSPSLSASPSQFPPPTEQPPRQVESPDAKQTSPSAENIGIIAGATTATAVLLLIAFFTLKRRNPKN